MKLQCSPQQGTRRSTRSRGEISPRNHAHCPPEPWTATGAAIRPPSPRGEGRGEGDRDIRWSGRLLGNEARSRKVQGVALVITLILLAVITFMTVTFLVVTRSESGNVRATTDQATAALAAETALEQAQVQIIAPMLAFTNASMLGFMVSTNYQSPYFTNGSQNFLNVNYLDQSGQPLSGNNALLNLANLLYLPRAPVFLTNLYHTNEFRFYFDANRNERFEPSGWLVVTNSLGQPITSSSNVWITNFYQGDPQWIGILERGSYVPSLLGATRPAGFPHGPNNRFLSRYAFMVIPSSTALDVNSIHNYGRLRDPNMAVVRGDCFLRNMGAATWEINLAAFLTDLNTNYWPATAVNTYNFRAYQYDPALGQFNTGAGFDDALALLRYRYSTNWNRYLSSVNGLYGLSNGFKFQSDWIDAYCTGPVMSNFLWRPIPGDSDNATRVNLGWCGADNLNHFSDPQDFWDKTKTAFGQNPDPAISGLLFSDRLRMSLTNNDSYNRYTFSRLVGQLGMDSSPEGPKQHLNYANVDKRGQVVPNLATNFQPWEPTQFFTNAAIRMLVDALDDPANPSYITNFVNTLSDGTKQLNIRIYPTNYYTPAVHRIMQVAANIYDASTTRTYSLSNGFPTVFQPLFTDNLRGAGAGSNEVFITGYVEVTNSILATGMANPRLFHDLSDLTDRTSGRGPLAYPAMVHGIPLVVGAKKGFPNFNTFASETWLRVTRKLEFRKSSPNGAVVRTNQMYVLSLTNSFGTELWNSYSNFYPRPLQIYALAEMTAVVTNDAGRIMYSNSIVRSNANLAAGAAIVSNFWPGFVGPNANANNRKTSFGVVPMPNGSNVFGFLPKARYSERGGRFVIILAEDDPFTREAENPSGFPVPHWFLVLRTRLRLALVDADTKPFPRIIDYVNLEAQESPLDVADLLQRADPSTPSQCGGFYSEQSPVYPWQMWCTNKTDPADLREPSYGIRNQIALNFGSIGPEGNNYASQYEQDQAGHAVMCQINGFRQQFGYSAKPSIFGQTPCQETSVFYPSNVFNAPFSPKRDLFFYTRWEANDPLVHYTVPDLAFYDPPGKRIALSSSSVPTTNNAPSAVLGDLSGGRRYEPWFRSKDAAPKPNSKISVAQADISMKDIVRRSDEWDFPTNKFPNIGLLGRVHRGTPWQTIYFKSQPNPTNYALWTNWTGHSGFIALTNSSGTNATLKYDYVISYPTNDYRLLDLFTTAFNDNASRGQLSVNNTNLASWSAVLSGVAVVTNANPATPAVFIQPAGPYDAQNSNTWPALVRIVEGMNRVRSAVDTNTGQLIYPQQTFQHIGDILRAPELTLGSPYLAGTDPNANITPPGLNDEVYERIPQQIMSLLRGGGNPPRFVIYAFGQSLRPAEHSVVTSGQLSGMVTNYQVTAETALRVVVRVDGAPKNPHVVIESYNVLPPYQ